MKRADCRAIATLLAPDSALIEFVRFSVVDFRKLVSEKKAEAGEARYVAFCLLADEPERVRLVTLGEAEPIDRLVGGFRARLLESGQQKKQGTVAADAIG